MKCFIVSRHPQSSQYVYDLITHLSSDLTKSFFVYGVQNNTPHVSRSQLNSNVTVKCSPENRLELESLGTEISNYSPDTLIVIHNINVVTTIIESILTLLTNELSYVNVSMYCEIPRKYPNKTFIDKLTTIKETLGDRFSMFTPSRDNAKLVNGLQVLPYGVGNFQRLAKSEARRMLGLEENKTIILSVGRVDTGAMSFAKIASEFPDTLLMIPVDNVVKEHIQDILTYELDNQGERVIMMKEISSLSMNEVVVALSAVDIVLHANVVTDFNMIAHIAAQMQIPQVISQSQCEYLTNNVFTDEGFDIYTYDDYGGKVELHSPYQFANALRKVLTKNTQSILNIENTTLMSWDNWNVLFRSATRPSKEDEVEKYKREVLRLQKELNDLRGMKVV